MVIWYLIVVHLIPSLASSEKERACNEQPPSIPNTYITPVVLQEYKHGTLLQYKCGQSFDQSGRNSYVTCVDGQWIRDLANMIRCIPGHCTQIDSREIDNGRVKSISGIVGTYAEFECDDGYELDGSAQILCMSDRKWHPKIPTCKPGLCTQIYSREIDNGRVKIISGMDGTYADFECDDGYELDGSAQILCMAERKWHPKIPTCKAISCPEPTQLINGKLTEEDYNGVRNTFQSTIRYECNKGYRMVGPQFRTCQSDRTWSGNDTKCEEILCDKPSPPENGKVYLTDNSEKVGSQIEYTCDERHILVPNTSQFAICTEHGHWSKQKPECKKYCEVRSLQHGSFRDPNRLYRKITDDTYVLDNTELFFACDYGYEAHALGYDTNRRLKCYNGTWFPGSPECKPKRCQISNTTIIEVYDTSKENPTAVGEKIPSGSTILLMCPFGHELYDESKSLYIEREDTNITCYQGRFEADIPSCKPRRCQVTDITVINGHFRYNGNVIPAGEKIPSGSKIQLICSEGYELYQEVTLMYMEKEDTDILCHKGSFDAAIPSCKPKFCNEPPVRYTLVENGMNVDENAIFSHGTKLNVSCDSSSTLHTDRDNGGNGTLSECIHGEWKPTFSCKPCDLAKVDLVFILDSSTSVTEPTYRKMLTFCKDFLRNADIDSGNVRVSVVIYSTDVAIQFHLNRYSIKTDLFQAIDKIPYIYGATNTADGLKVMRTEIFTLANGDRTDVDNIAVIITDGNSNINSRRTISEAVKARAMDIHIYAIGIGLSDRKKLDAIASEPAKKNSFSIKEFDELVGLETKIFTSTCLAPLCSELDFQCGTGTCISLAWRCDGDQDCDDGSDETDECKAPLCSELDFQCGTGTCIRLAWRCDGDQDCEDGSDETDECKALEL